MDRGQRLFASDVLTRYPPGLDASKLTHRYTPVRLDSKGRQIDFARIKVMLDSLKTDVARWYADETGEKFNGYTLGSMIHAVRRKFWEDPRFEQVFMALGLDLNHIPNVQIPWWNEVGAAELEHGYDETGVRVLLGPRHCIEAPQLTRAGVDSDVLPVAVTGMPKTRDGYLMIGLRGGVSYRNTYQVNGGALGLTDGIKTGEISIYDFFKMRELIPETGIRDADIEKAEICARIMDQSIDNGPQYLFLVNLRIDVQDMMERFEQNPSPSKAEHQSFVPVPATVPAVLEFLKENYRGVVANDESRRDHERRLLHSGAVALLASVGLPLSELKAFYQDGVW